MNIDDDDGNCYAINTKPTSLAKSRCFVTIVQSLNSLDIVASIILQSILVPHFEVLQLGMWITSTHHTQILNDKFLKQRQLVVS